MSIRLAPNLELPPSVVTQKIAILAVSGAGKTYTGKLLAEELLEHGLWTVIVDPVGVWWGLRSSADGKREGYPIPLLGGDHRDIPLDPNAGELVAHFLIERRLPAILDISDWSNQQQTKFLTAFCNELYRLKKASSPPLMMILDEADQYAPQRAMGKHELPLLGAWERIVRRGRAKGLGFCMITQRGAALNKNVLTQIETLIAMRNTSPQDSAAIRAWVEQHGTPEQTKELLESLPSLPNGVGWVWSPYWAKLFQKSHFRKARTYDSSKTPEPGEERIDPRKLADVDLAKLEEAFRAQVEEAKASDPTHLRRRIAELEREVRERPEGESGEWERKIEQAYEEGYKTGVLAEHERMRGPIDASTEELRRAVEALSSKLILETAPPPRPALVHNRANRAPVAKMAKSLPRPAAPPPASAERLNGSPASVDGLERYDMRLLEVIVGRHPMKLNRSQLAALAGVSPKSSSYDKSLKRLKDGRWMHSDGGRFTPSPAAMSLIGTNVSDVPKTPKAMIEMWRSKLPDYAGAILDAVYRAHPGEVTKTEIGEAIGRSVTSSSFDKAIKLLRDNNLIASASGVYRVGEAIFL